QGFTLARPPAEAGSAVLLEMELTGTLLPTVAADGQAIDFSVPGGSPVLRYAELVVRDAQGRDLPARMEAFWGPETRRGIRLVFDDKDAVYPVVVDPLATSPSWSAEGNQDLAQFGAAVGTAGDVNWDGHADVIVGAPFFDSFQADKGRAFVYLGEFSGLGTTPSWIREGDQAMEQFGSSVGTAGDVNGDGFADVV